MPVNLEIWNPSALRKPRNMDLTYQRVHVFMVMYDITQRRSFAEAKKLVDAFTRKARPGAFVVLVGNKTDLESRREVSLKVSNVAMFIECQCATCG